MAGLDHNGDAAAGILRADGESLRGDLQDGAGEPVVGHQQVGAAADDQQRLAGGVRRSDGLDDFGLGAGLDETSGGAADGGRGQGGKQSLGHLTSLAGFGGLP